MHILEHLLGLDSANGDWYLWWSGFGADLGMFGAVIAVYYKHNCHTRGCLRIGKHQVEGTPYCTKHKML